MAKVYTIMRLISVADNVHLIAFILSGTQNSVGVNSDPKEPKIEAAKYAVSSSAQLGYIYASVAKSRFFTYGRTGKLNYS